MAIDGALLSYIKNEIKKYALGCRVEKVYQPSKYEIILCLRGMSGNFKLLMSSSSNSARVHFTAYDIPNPLNPPMFCMLLRKKLSMAKLIDVRQQNLERVLYLDFMAKNELGDDTNITIAVEIMDKYSNIILIEDGFVVDAIKRVNSEMSSKRLVLPKVKYEFPPKQDKVNIFEVKEPDLDYILNVKTDVQVYRLINSHFQGISSSLIKRLLFYTLGNAYIKSNELSDSDILKLKNELFILFSMIKDSRGMPVDVFFESKKEVSFVSFDCETVCNYNTFSDLIDKVYFEQDKTERIYCKTNNLVKHLKRVISRLENKIKEQKKELAACKDKDKYKLFGDLIMANLHLITIGKSSIELTNYYDENCTKVNVGLLPQLSGVKNSQAYYKRYKKLCSAEKVLLQEINKASSDIEYLYGVIDFLSRTETEQELYEICNELEENKYIKKAKSKNKIKFKPLKPLEFTSEDGFKILVGRNSKQNDTLTMKIASKSDIWFHVKDLQGSHVVLVTNGKAASEKSISLAANLSVLYSKACNSSNVAVDYTEVKNVKKFPGAKPGLVNYINYNTIYVTPTKNIN